MRFPNKVNPYRKTILASMEMIMERLAEPINCRKLIEEVTSLMDPLNAAEALICLFALSLVTMNEEGVIAKC